MGKNFLGLDGLKHFWSKAKTWIINRITTEVTAKIAEIVANAPEDLDTLKEIADWISTHEDSASAMNTAILANTEAISGKADKSHTHTKSEITDFPTSLPANGGKAAKSSFLDEYVGAGGTRPTSINFVPKNASEYGGIRKDVVTSPIDDSGYPGQDGHLLTMFWDNSGRYDSQVFVSNEKQPTAVKVRVKANEADYGPWVDLITSQNIGSQTVAKASTAGTADYANVPTGFEKIGHQDLWGNQDGVFITDWQTFAGEGNNGDISFRVNDGQLNVIIDGFFYQNEGRYKLVDENSLKDIMKPNYTTGRLPAGIYKTGQTVSVSASITTTRGNPVFISYSGDYNSVGSGDTVPWILFELYVDNQIVQSTSVDNSVALNSDNTPFAGNALAVLSAGSHTIRLAASLLGGSSGQVHFQEQENYVNLVAFEL